MSKAVTCEAPSWGTYCGLQTTRSYGPNSTARAHDPSVDAAQLPPYIGPARAWDAGNDGRLVLDPLCATTSRLLAGGGTLLVVQSEFAGPRQTLAALAAPGWMLKLLLTNGFRLDPC